jgi:hypothetical protein
MYSMVRQRHLVFGVSAVRVLIVSHHITPTLLGKTG